MRVCNVKQSIQNWGVSVCGDGPDVGRVCASVMQVGPASMGIDHQCAMRGLCPSARVLQGTSSTPAAKPVTPATVCTAVSDHSATELSLGSSAARYQEGNARSRHGYRARLTHCSECIRASTRVCTHNMSMARPQVTTRRDSLTDRDKQLPCGGV